MKIIESFIANKVYNLLYLDILLKLLWERVIELWNIGGSGILGAIALLFLMLLIILLPLIPFIIATYFIYKFFKG